MHEAARRAGAPDGSINWMTTVTLEGHAGADEGARNGRHPGDRRHGAGARGLQRRQAGLRRRSGQRPGLHRVAPPTWPRRCATSSPARPSTTALLCSSENSVVVDAPLVEEVKRAVRRQRRALHVGRRDRRGRRALLVTPQRLPNPKLVGRPATYIAQQAGITVPPDTRVLIAELPASAATTRCRSRSSARSSPSMSSSDWREGCERCKQILRYGGMGHTMSIHSRNDDVILQFGLKKPAVPHRRQHADDAWIDRADDRARSGDDAGMRRLRRQHHVGQHLAATPAEHQAAGVRDDARAPSAGAAAAGRGRGAAAEGARAAARAGRHCRRAAGAADRPVLASRGYTPPPAAPATTAEPAAPAPSAPDRHAGARSPAEPRRRRLAPSGARRKTCRVRVRRRRPAGGQAGPQNRDRRANDRDAGRAGSRRAARLFVQASWPR